jgi:hypothetical protein
MSLTSKKGHTKHKNGMGFETASLVKDLLVKPIQEENRRRNKEKGYKSLNEAHRIALEARKKKISQSNAE